MGPQDVRIVFVTSPEAVAADLLRTLVDERLVAGGNILPGVRSLYRWKGQVCDDAEAVLLMETWADREEALIDRVRALHPYQTPKILTFTPSAGFAPYAAWVEEMTRG